MPPTTIKPRRMVAPTDYPMTRWERFRWKHPFLGLLATLFAAAIALGGFYAWILLIIMWGSK